MSVPVWRVLVLGLWLAVGTASSAGAADPIGAVDTRRETANAGTVGIMAGGIDGTYARIASDLSAVLDDGSNLRVLAILGKGSVQNLGDILHLKGIDIGIVQSDVLAYAQRERLYPNLENRVRYITKLYNEEFHILAAPDIRRIEDLANRKVNFDGSGSGTYMTASLIFAALGIPVEPVTHDQTLALEKLRTGEIAALAYVAGKPTRLFSGLQSADGLHFLPVPLTSELLETYLPSRLTSDDYQALIRPGEDVETVAVGAVMAVYNWDEGTERHRKVSRFIDAFFSQFEEFLAPPRHAKWKEVNLAAEVPGWRRFGPAEAWLQMPVGSQGDEVATRDDFRTFVAQRGATTEQADALFEQFLRWRAENRQ